jgi:putative ABC transport system permease protein
MRDRYSGGLWTRLFYARAQAEVDDELKFHIEERAREYEARGMDPASARAAALERFGDLGAVRGECAQLLEAERRAAARRDWLGDLWQDLGFGLRSALRAPLFTLLALVTLALGIGANAAVFGVVKSVLLDTLPYADAERLVRVYGRLQTGAGGHSGVSAGVFVDLTERSRSFERLAVYYQSTLDLAYADESGAQVVATGLLGPGFLETLGVPPVIGRTFTPGDSDPASGWSTAAMLSHATWQRWFAEDPDVLGRTIRLNGRPYSVVGVLPRGFLGPMGKADFWLPFEIGPALSSPIRVRKQHWLGLVGRLAPGATVQTAQHELSALAAELGREHPESDGGHTLVAMPLRDSMTGDTRTPLLVLMASAALVLLITCANLAGAMLSRSVSRRKEFAVRVALGAGRGRLVRQLLTESTVLALAGGAAGLALASLALSVLGKLALPALPAYAELSLDAGAVLVTTLLAVGTGLAFGLAPALSAGRADLQASLRDETRGSSESLRSRRLRGLLVAGQIALSFSLLVGAGLLVRSLLAMTAAPLGFDPSGVLTARVSLPSIAYPTGEAAGRFFDALEERLRALPGVTGVASTGELPSPHLNRNGLAIEASPWPQGQGQRFITCVTVSDDYFRVLRIPLLSGRTFGPLDRPDTTEAIVISQAMARRYWPQGDALGARIRLGPDSEKPWSEVVGIVGDVRNDPASTAPEPIAYSTSRQDQWGSRALLLRTQGEPLALLPTLQQEVAALDPGLPLHGPQTLETFLSELLSGRRLPVVLMTAFGALALLLASVGVYALFASMVAARERELAVRVALGSTRRGIAALVLRQGAGWMAAGLAGGALGAVAVARLLGGLLHGVGPFDPVALGVAVTTLLVCAALALLAPVRRATRVDPIAALR